MSKVRALLDKIRQLLAKRRVSGASDPDEYLAAYREQTDLRVAHDPKEAIGGRWEELGQAQLSFLKKVGLEPQHSLLDLGCGTLRAGRLLIPYLDAGNYVGVDISKAAIDSGHALIAGEGLADKQPTLIFNEPGRLTFDFTTRKFDFVLAQSVFTHLPESLVRECLAHVHKVLAGHFYFTIQEGSVGRTGPKQFSQSRDWIRETVVSHGLDFADVSDLYDHPKGQLMLRASVRRADE